MVYAVELPWCVLSRVRMYACMFGMYACVGTKSGVLPFVAGSRQDALEQREGIPIDEMDDWR